MNMAVQLQDVTRGFEIVHSFPSLKKLPIIIGEFDPEGCAACSVKFNPQNAYRNGTMYSSYTAASFAQLYALAKKYDVNLQGAVSWSFEFEHQPWFAGFRDLATNGVDKPVLNVFRMFGMMKGKMLEVNNPNTLSLQQIVDSSVHGDQPYVNAVATLRQHEMYVLCWNYHDDDSKKSTALINLALQHIPAAKAAVSSYLVDETHSNSYSVWKTLGSPQQVSATQFKQLEKAGKLQTVETNKQLTVAKGSLHYQLSLTGQGVALLKFTW
jgi:xylan 1,4-beta-xylosidase